MARDRGVPHDVLASLLRHLKDTEDADVLRETAVWIVQELLEADVTEQIGALPYERSEERTTYRNGYRDAELETRLGELPLRIPRLRRGSYYPEWLLERRQPAEQALMGVIMEAYVNGVSTRKVTRLVEELGLGGIDKSKVSRINQGLDERVKGFRERPLEGPYPYVWFDGIYLKVREDGQVQSVAVVVAIGVNAEGYREVLGLAVGRTEDEAHWRQFMRSLVKRGLDGVQLVISDAHEGLRKAAQQVLTGAMWQRCRTHFLRDVLTHVPSSAESEVLDLLRTVFEQPNIEHARAQMNRVLDELEARFPKAAAIVEAATEDVLTHMNFPHGHWRRLRSTNPLERLNREIRRRTKTVGIFPNRQAVVRLVGANLLEQHEAWITGRRYISETSLQEVQQATSGEPPHEVTENEGKEDELPAAS